MNKQSGRVEDNSQNELVLAQYKTPECEIDFGLSGDGETIWATQIQMAELFDVDRSVIGKHLKGIFDTEELTKEATCAIFAQVRTEGERTVERNIEHYNLDAILSVGYRVSSPRATKFRQWANRTLSAFVQQGYALNEAVLRASPDKLNALAARVRALRSEERSVYEKVRECFKVSASDYEPSAPEVRSFYALLQDKFHHAVTQMTGSKLILDRADHTAENMGLVSFDGPVPTMREVKVGKNYLRPEELYQLHLLSEQFLLFAEVTALRGQKMTMTSLGQQLDRLLVLNNYPVFDGYKDYLKDVAVDHAIAELRNYRIRLKIEEAGLSYDPEGVALGEYDDILKN
ncbi:RhuM family protein [Gluconobacter oxydans]|nr:RhuM family protein [Gluconobacter oxydans]